MPIIYITGISGSGKSTVRQELQGRGYKVYGTDEDGIAFFYHNETGEPVVRRIAPHEHTPQWRSEHTWKVRRETVERLAEANRSEMVFLCGVVANDVDELWDLFDRVFALNIDEETLRHRITNRINNDFGKADHELDMLLRWQKTAEDDYTRAGAVVIDAIRPVEWVVDDILSRLKL